MLEEKEEKTFKVDKEKHHKIDIEEKKYNFNRIKEKYFKDYNEIDIEVSDGKSFKRKEIDEQFPEWRNDKKIYKKYLEKLQTLSEENVDEFLENYISIAQFTKERYKNIEGKTLLEKIYRFLGISDLRPNYMKILPKIKKYNKLYEINKYLSEKEQKTIKIEDLEKEVKKIKNEYIYDYLNKTKYEVKEYKINGSIDEYIKENLKEYLSDNILKSFENVIENSVIDFYDLGSRNKTIFTSAVRRYALYKRRA